MVYTLLCPISYTQMFCQVKNLKKIHNQGKPNHYSTCSCQVKNGQYFVNRFSIHEMALSERILGRYSRKCCPILPHQKWHSSKQKYCLNFFWRIRVLMKIDVPRVCIFVATLTPLFPLKMSEIERNVNFSGKTSAIGLSKHDRIKTLSPLPFPKKKIRFLIYIRLPLSTLVYIRLNLSSDLSTLIYWLICF